MSRDTRPPQSRRARRSRPTSSVPRGWAAEGGAQKPASRSLALGSSPSSGGRSSTASSSAHRISKQATARRSLRNRSQGLRDSIQRSTGLPPPIAHPGIGQPVGQIQEQVGQEHRQGDDHRHPHDHRIVPVLNAPEEQAAHARPAEHLLHHH
ncbi:Uncharacterised protein [Flavonifractor plautii]|uniref:Uncharacterized protein n=1 Tax=Flavonifractor plautii TaxID=292800 RepID=A0A174S8P8_FLAPL|nr:Uncharacterised protein [Flavonifractor plautii]